MTERMAVFQQYRFSDQPYHRLVLLLALLIAQAWVSVQASNIYTYRGPDGGILFTDQPQNKVGEQHTLLSVRKGWSYQHRALSHSERNRYDSLITQAANRHQVDPALVKAVIHAESLFDRYAVSRAGAQGLMQLMPRTAEYLQVDNVFSPQENINGGTRFLAYLMGKFSDLDHVLAAYNAGEGNVRRYGGIPPFRETQNYVKKVKELRSRYASEFVAGLGEAVPVSAIASY